MRSETLTHDGTEVWDDHKEEFIDLDEEFDTDTGELVEIEQITDLDGWDQEDLEEGIRKRRELLEDNFEIENPEKSVITLEEVEESHLDSARNYVADFLEHREGTRLNGLANLSVLGSSIPSALMASRQAVLYSSELAGTNPENPLLMAVGIPALAAGAAAPIYSKIKFDEARDGISNIIRPSSKGGLPVIGEDVDENVERLIEDSRVVEVQNLTGTVYELEGTVEGSWFHNYLTTRYDEPHLNHLSWKYDTDKEQLEWTLDYIVDWNHECPIEIGDEQLGSVDAYRFRGKLDEKEPEHIEDIFSDYSHEEGKEKVEEAYGSRVSELLEDFGYFEKNPVIEEVDRTTAPGGMHEGAPGTITFTYTYPVSSEK